MNCDKKIKGIGLKCDQGIYVFLIFQSKFFSFVSNFGSAITDTWQYLGGSSSAEFTADPVFVAEEIYDLGYLWEVILEDT